MQSGTRTFVQEGIEEIGKKGGEQRREKWRPDRICPKLVTCSIMVIKFRGERSKENRRRGAFSAKDKQKILAILSPPIWSTCRWGELVAFSPPLLSFFFFSEAHL